MAEAVVSRSGKVGTLPEDVAEQAAEVGAVRTATPSEIGQERARLAEQEKKAALADKYSLLDNPGTAIAGQAMANVAAIYRGATFGLSDVAASKLGGEAARSKLNELQEAFPVSSAVNEFGGMAGSMALGGEALGAGKAATVAGRVARGAARAGVEMGLYGAGKEASREALAGEDLNAQKILASGAHEGLLGLALGGGLSAAAEGLGALRASRAASAATRATKAGEAAEGAAASGKSGGVGEWFQRKSDEAFLRATGGRQNQIAKIQALDEGAGVRRVVDDVKRELREEFGAKRIPADPEELLDATKSAIKRKGEVKTGMLDKLDASGSAIAPGIERPIAAIEEKFIKPNLVAKTVETPEGAVTKMVPTFGKESTVEEARNIIGRLRSGVGDTAPTFKRWDQMIRDLGDEVTEASWGKPDVSPAVQVKRSIYGILNDELSVAGDEAAAKLGESFSAGYKANQKVLQSLYKAQELLQVGAARGVKNNSLGLTTRMAGMTGSIIGAAIGGGVPGAIVGGAVSTAAAKLANDHGAMLASDLLERAASVLGVRSVAARAEAGISRGVGELLGKASNDNASGLAPPRVRAARPSGLPREQFSKIESQLQQVVSNPARTAENVSRAVGNMHDVSPRLSDALVATVLRGADYLHKELPKSHVDPFALQPQLQKPRVADADVSRFMRKADVVSSPLVVLDEAKRGTLTRDHVEALKAVYPDLYDTMREQVMTTLIDSKSELPYAKRIQLGILLDIPTDKTLSPDFLKAIQGTYQPSGDEEAGGQPPPPQTAPQLALDKPTMTATESAASRL